MTTSLLHQIRVGAKCNTLVLLRASEGHPSWPHQTSLGMATAHRFRANRGLSCLFLNSLLEELFSPVLTMYQELLEAPL